MDRAPNHPINTSRREQRHLFGPDCIANKTQVVSREEKRKEGRKEGKEKETRGKWGKIVLASNEK